MKRPQKEKRLILLQTLDGLEKYVKTTSPSYEYHTALMLPLQIIEAKEGTCGKIRPVESVKRTYKHEGKWHKINTDMECQIFTEQYPC